MSLIIPAAIGAAGSIASNVAQNIGNKKSQKRAQEWNLQQWHRQNAYNDPRQQIDRLKKAGLNPNLIYGTSPTSAVGNAGAIPAAKAADYSFENPLQHLSSYANFSVQQAQTDNLHAQSAVIAQEAALKGAQTANTAAQTSRSKFDLNLAQELKNTSVDAAKQNLRLLEQKTIQTEIDNTIKDQSAKDVVKRIHYEAENASISLKGQKLTNKLRELEINLNKLGVQKGDNLFFRILGQFMGQNNVIEDYKNRVKINLNNKK